MHKFIGRTIDIIYQDRHGELSKRRIRISAVGADKILAYDYDRRAPRVFRRANILSYELVKSA